MSDTTSKWDAMGTDEMGNYLSDWFKEVHGFRPRYDGLYSNRAWMIEMLDDLERFTNSAFYEAELREVEAAQAWFDVMEDFRARDDNVFYELTAPLSEAEQLDMAYLV